MPGRFGHGGEIEILPMEFPDFKKAYQDAKFEPCDELTLLKKYFWTGGFPIALAETKGTFNPPSQTVDTIKRWLLGDAIKLGKNENYLRDMLLQLAITQQSPISLQKLAQRTQMGSHHTAIDYVTLLEATFCLKTLYAYDLSRNVFQYKKDKKFYFRDPIYFHLAYAWSSLPLPADYEEKMAEACAHEFLQKRHPRLGYFHTQKGEVDFISPNEFGIEVKWSDRLTNLSKAYKELPLPQKEVWGPARFFGEKISG
jgi:predicted AAA+ superfamily ATPase